MSEKSSPCAQCDQAACPSAGQAVANREKEMADRLKLEQQMRQIRHKILVLSGKGGVGKSTVAANLAILLGLKGKRVGLLDIDIHGPSVPRLLGLEGARVGVSEDEMMVPVTFADTLKVMSIGFLLRNPDDAVIWRGPLKMGVIRQFLKDVDWGALDYLIVDSPPGTGDEPLSICQLIENPSGAIIVTTPQDLSVIDVKKCIRFCEQLEVPVLGVVENMSGFVCPHCGERVDIFKRGGGEKLAAETGVPFLGAIPIDPAVTEDSDEGRAVVQTRAKAPVGQAFEKIADAVLQL